MNRLELEVTTKRCKQCSWSSSYTNWTPAGAPRLPNTYLCKNPNVTEVRPDCGCYSEKVLEEYGEECL